MSIGLDDEICRSIVYAKAFTGSIHVDEKLIIFGQSGADGASHESVFLRRLVSSEEALHGLGCNIAATQNSGRGNPEPGPKRRYYCGYRSAPFSKLKLTGDGYNITLTLDGENGVPAHVDVALRVDATDRNARATAKVQAGMILAEAFGPASEYICECDKDDTEHPLNKDSTCLQIGVRDTSIYA